MTAVTRIVLLIGVAIAATAPVTVDASAATQLCDAGEPAGRVCTRVSVPLDRDGGVPGTVSLHVERQPAVSSQRPPVFLLAGGPGQAASAVYPSQVTDEILGEETQARDLVVMDLRGTGRSGVLRCPSLESRVVEPPTAVGVCAARLGPRRAFYTANHSAADIEAVRLALGMPKIALMGVSYGTEVALAYAARHPDRVERLVLDSPVELNGPDPLLRTTMRAAPRLMDALCAGACRRRVQVPGVELSRLAARLERGPLRGGVTDKRGRRRKSAIDADGLLKLLIFANVDPHAAAGLPAAVRNAARGDIGPLLRVQARLTGVPAQRARPDILSPAAYAAAICEESTFPWSGASTPGQRRAQAVAAITALPVSAFAPFGRSAALGSDQLRYCEQWPDTSGNVPVTKPLPNVPTLVLASDTDTRAPIENAKAIVARIPKARLMTVHGGGHVVLSSYDSRNCVVRWIASFLAGAEIASCAPRIESPAPAIAPAPSSFRELRPAGRLGGRRGRTLAALRLTVADGLVALWGRIYWEWALGFGDTDFIIRGIREGALRRGSYGFSVGGNAYYLFRASLVPGVRVSGILGPSEDGSKILRGRLLVGGPAAARGRFQVRRGFVTGKLDGRKVRFKLDPGNAFIDSPSSLGAAVRASTAPAPSRPLLGRAAR